MQFQVPQFIDTEDKVIGPLSLRQFAFLGIGGVLSAILYLIAQPWLWALASLFIFAIAIALAFVKIEGRPFLTIAISAFQFYWKPQTYVWQPEHKTVAVSVRSAASSTASGEAALEDILSHSTMAYKRQAPVITGVRQKPVAPAEEVEEKQKTQTPEVAPRAMPVFSAPPSVAPVTPIKPAAPTAKIVIKSESMPAAAPDSLQEREAALVSRAAASIGSALHKSWESLQTGASFTKKSSDKQFLDRKMAERYQIFQRVEGDRHAARRIDYR
jgi:hypothetical protein